MSYLLIKQNDVKTFKSFLSGREIEIGVFVNSNVNVFGTGEEVDLFYGDDYSDTYKAKIVRQKPSKIGDKLLIQLGLIKR
jgi:hypothetical protein